MSTWNVARTVVDLIDADTPEQAEAIIDARLRAAGFDLYDAEQPATFESEPV